MLKYGEGLGTECATSKSYQPTSSKQVKLMASARWNVNKVKPVK